MRTKQTNTMPRPRMTVRGEFGGDIEELFAHKLAPVARHAHAPVLDVRVWLSRHADPAVALPVEARVNLDVNGRQVRADAVAHTARDAADLVSEADALAKQEFRAGHDEQPHGDREGRERWYRSQALTAAELMTSPVLTIRADAPVSVAARQLAKKKVRRLFVVDGFGRVAGVVSRRDLLRIYLLSDEDIREEVESLLASAVGAAPDTTKVSVSSGVATVDGVLRRRRQVDSVSRIVSALPGVVGVRNNLRYVIDDVHR